MAMLRESPDALTTRAASTVSPVITTGHDLCTACGVNPRAGKGANTKCVPCLKAAAAAYSRHRAEAEATYASRIAVSAKTCRGCKKELSLGAFAPHPLAKDGHRNFCRKCVAKGRRHNHQMTPKRKARARELRQRPEQKARNLEAVYRWRAANPAAIAAHAVVDEAIRTGEITPPKTCQAHGCRKRRGLASHHNSYAANRRKAVVWLCSSHHRSAHSGRPVALKKSAGIKVAHAPKAA
jgi:hypothetical protein